MKQIFYIFLLSVLLVSCQKNNSLFYGEMHPFSLPEDIDTLKAREIHFNEVQTGQLFVYDSLLFFKSEKYPGYSISIFHARNGKHLGNCFLRGNGPHEFYNLSFIYHMNEVNGQPHMYMYAMNEQKLIDIDLKAFTKDLGSTGAVDYTAVTISDCLWSAAHTSPFYYLYPINGMQRLLVKTQFDTPYMNEAPTLPSYEILDRKTGQISAEFPIFKTSIKNRALEKKRMESFFHLSTDALRPDGKRAAMVMRLIPQINIFNVETGDIHCYRLEGISDSDIEKESEADIRLYYGSTTADEHYIYSLYIDKPIFTDNGIHFAQSNEIHLFDWEGRLLKRWRVEQQLDAIILDPQSGLLYAQNGVTDQTYVYDLKDDK